MNEKICPQCQASVQDDVSICPVCNFSFVLGNQSSDPGNNKPTESTEETIDLKTISSVDKDQVWAEVHSGNIFLRAIRIIVKPRSEWEKISTEKPRIALIIFSYVTVLSLIPIISISLGRAIFNFHFYYNNFLSRLLSGMVVGIIFAMCGIAAVLIAAYIINKLAQAFQTEPHLGRAIQLTAYSFTPMFLAASLYMIPYLGYVVFPLGLYGIILLLFGQPIVMKVPKSNQIAYFFTSIGILFGSFFLLYYSIRFIHGLLSKGFYMLF